MMSKALLVQNARLFLLDIEMWMETNYSRIFALCNEHTKILVMHSHNWIMNSENWR
jgi:hypothetical protein